MAACSFRSPAFAITLTEHHCDLDPLDWVEKRPGVFVQVVAEFGCRESFGLGGTVYRPFAVRENGKVAGLRVAEDAPVRVMRHTGPAQEREAFGISRLMVA